MLLSSFLSHQNAEYIHAKEMYAIRDISSPKLIYGMGIAGGVAFGVSIPIFAVNFQQAKGGWCLLEIFVPTTLEREREKEKEYVVA